MADKNSHAGRSPKNKTLCISDIEIAQLKKFFLSKRNLTADKLRDGIFHGDYKNMLEAMPSGSIKLLFLDPPYNMAKNFNGSKFSRRSVDEYTKWLDELLGEIKEKLSPEASIYICGDWFSSVSIFTAASNHFIVRNRICWEREKGRGAKANWKNSSEDIWFCTMSDSYIFNVDKVKLRRKVVAPYRDQSGSPKDWNDTKNGAFRDTHPSNIWTDITIPFWSMPENTEHPTQKSEKLLAKLILASSNEGDLVFDPFAGSGTSLVVAKKLQRHYLGAEQDELYCLLTQKRLLLAETDKRIQGFADGVFWERNTLAEQLAFED
jgi:site-specific DNA-methyltransferase (adenine-specific)